MGAIREHAPVMLVVGTLSRDGELYGRAMRAFTGVYGELLFESEPIPFTFTDYYEPEMGSDLIRRFVAFARLVSPEALTDIKLFSNALEEELSVDGRRAVNLDPGYLCAGKLVLASTKDNQHRIYVDKGIFHEITLRYRHGTFQPWEWTFPDYRTQQYIDLLNDLRRRYLERLRGAQP